MSKKFILTVAVIFLSTAIYAQDNEQVFRHIKRAETAYKMENYTDAIEEYEKVIKIDPKHADAYYNLAVICEKMQTDYYLRQAIGYYKKYMELVPREKDNIREKVYELEYLMEKKVQGKEHFESVLGFWKTTTYDQKTGQPDYIVEITPFQGKLRVKLLPNSKMYSTSLNNIVATVELYKENLLFTYTDNKNHVPNPAKWDALKVAGALAGSYIGGSIGSVAGDIVGDVISAGTEAAGNIGGAAESVTTTQKFHDFYITEFGTDTLKGFVHQFASVKENKTSNIRILTDDVTPVIFVRGGERYKIKGSYLPRAFGIEAGYGGNGNGWAVDFGIRYTMNISPYFGIDVLKLKFDHIARLKYDGGTNASVQLLAGVRGATPNFGRKKNTNLFSALRLGGGYQLDTNYDVDFRLKYNPFSLNMECDLGFHFRHFFIGIFLKNQWYKYDDYLGDSYSDQTLAGGLRFGWDIGKKKVINSIN